MINPAFPITIAIVLAGCAADTTVRTKESWTQVSPEQAAAPLPKEVDVYTEPPPPPQVGKNGCAPMYDAPGGIKTVNRTNPREVYCLYVAPMQLSTLLLPIGSQLVSTQIGMGDFMATASANTGGRTLVSLQAKCTPQVRDAQGNLKETAMQEQFGQQALPYCPRYSSDMVLMTTSGPLYFRLTFSESTRTRVVDLANEPVIQRKTRIPERTPVAQDLYATSVDGKIIPWVPDEAWADASTTVILWNRPMPTLPAMMINKIGTEVATPVVVNEGNRVAMIYSRRVTKFQLRMADRILIFTDTPEQPQVALQTQAQQQIVQPGTPQALVPTTVAPAATVAPAPPPPAPVVAQPRPAPQTPPVPLSSVQQAKVPPQPLPAAPAVTAGPPPPWPTPQMLPIPKAQPVEAAMPIPVISGNGGGKP